MSIEYGTLHHLSHLLDVSKQSGILKATNGAHPTLRVDAGRIVQIACGGVACPDTAGHDLQAVILFAYLAPDVVFTSHGSPPRSSRWSVSSGDVSHLIAAMRADPDSAAAVVPVTLDIPMTVLPFVPGRGPAPDGVVTIVGKQWDVLRAAMTRELPRTVAAATWAILARLIHEGMLAVDEAEACPLIGAAVRPAGAATTGALPLERRGGGDEPRSADVGPQYSGVAADDALPAVWSTSSMTLRRLVGALRERQ